MDETVRIGALVIATDGEVGTVERIVTDPEAAVPLFLVVRTTDDEMVEIPYERVAANSTADEVRLTASRDDLRTLLTTSTATTIATTVVTTPAVSEEVGLDEVGDEIVVPVREEVLLPTTRPIELGEVLIHKRVESVPYQTLVDVTRDDIDIQRVTINEAVDAVPGPRQEGETLVIPVVEEVLVTEKRLMLREEIRVTRRQVVEQVRVHETLRREVIEIEDPEGGVTRAGGGELRGVASPRSDDDASRS